MGYFRIMPNTLLAQREELEAAYRALCQDISETSAVIRQLRTMTGFDGPVEALRRTQQRGNEQQAKLRQYARVLEKLAELYIRTELENLDGGSPMLPFASQAPQRRQPSITWELQDMLPDAEKLLGMKVTIQDRD